MRELATHLQVQADFNALAAENERLVGYYSKAMHRLRVQIERQQKRIREIADGLLATLKEEGAE